ncbi:MAG: 4Fe-4S binding protein [Spirochaetales bacterium]|nr:4Fe-4S binding protein [Spirochaetales bacterium]
MKQIAILSGKGGTGKTSIAGAMGFIAENRAVLCDCDVDASNLPLTTASKVIKTSDFSGGFAAEIDYSKCVSCGICAKVCRFDAVIKDSGSYQIQKNLCEGCGYCSVVCPVKAIRLTPVVSGSLSLSTSRFGSFIVHADLHTGAENSGKLSSQVRAMAREIAAIEEKDLIIIDGPPGISCPAIAAISGADFVLFVAEPSQSGLSDYKRALELSQKMRIPSGLVVNRADINPEITELLNRTARQANSEVLGSIPFSDVFPRALRSLKTVPELQDCPTDILNTLKNLYHSITRPNTQGDYK